MKYKLGILGGMGPLATSKLFERIILKTKASCDQEHLDMCILNYSHIPDRTNAILNNGESPIKYLNQGINDLINNHCDYFIIPCNTAHYFQNSFCTQGKIKFISMIDETLNYLIKNHHNKSICLLATSGTVKTDIYQKGNIKLNYPALEEQREVMRIITNTKAGIDERCQLKELINKINAEVFVLACTELSVYYEYIKDIFINKTIIDAMDVLIDKAITTCGYEIK